MPRFKTKLIAAALTSVLLVSCGSDNAGDNAAANMTAASAPDGVQLTEARNGSWINLSGQVVSTTPTSFLLDYGAGTVTVEMDDWDWYKEGRALRPGDQVIVSGRVDKDLFQNRTVEASGVYVKNLNTHFFASAADEENIPVTTIYYVAEPGFTDATGNVTAINGRDFMLGSDAGSIRVDTSKLADNPLDDQGFQQIKMGDRVYVWGNLDLTAPDHGALMAKGIVTLSKDKTKKM